MGTSIGVRSLLDVNVLVSLAVEQHPFNRQAHSWFLKEPDRLWASCPMTQSGFLRTIYRMSGGGHSMIREALESYEINCQSPNHEYWPVDVDLRDLTQAQRSRLIGANQIADMQLLLLAYRHGAQLVTFDHGVIELVKGTRLAESLLIL